MMNGNAKREARNTKWDCGALAVTFMLAMMTQPSLGQTDSLRSRIIKAIDDLAYNAGVVLLDEEGKSRCEYSWTEGTWSPYEEPWHTGQIINALCDAYEVTQNPEYLRQAKRAGDWWCGLLITDHPKLNGMIRAYHGQGVEAYIFATTSDGTPGLYHLYDITKERRYADVPTSAGAWMLEHMYIPEHGVFYDAIDMQTGEVMKERSPFWPEKAQQSLFDVARPNNEGSLFKDMYEYTGDVRYKEVFIALCNSLVDKQGPEGLWMQFTPNNAETGDIHPRFNLWNAESLLEGYALTTDRRYLAAAKKTLAFYAAKMMKKDGTIYYSNNLDGSYKDNSVCGSAVAFAGMLWIRLAEYGVGEEFRPHIEKAFAWVMKNRFPVDHPDPNLRGGLINTKVRSRGGKMVLMQRDLGTPFGIRFLRKYLDYVSQ